MTYQTVSYCSISLTAQLRTLVWPLLNDSQVAFLFIDDTLQNKRYSYFIESTSSLNKAFLNSVLLGNGLGHCLFRLTKFNYRLWSSAWAHLSWVLA
jgi:hypothetical protein